MRHVGDVDLKFVVAIGELAHEDGVVKVAGGFAVDGDDGQRRGSRGGACSSAGGMAEEMARASAMTEGGKWWGRWCLRMMISTSTPKSSS